MYICFNIFHINTISHGWRLSHCRILHAVILRAHRPNQALTGLSRYTATPRFQKLANVMRNGTGGAIPTDQAL